MTTPHPLTHLIAETGLFSLSRLITTGTAWGAFDWRGRGVGLGPLRNRFLGNGCGFLGDGTGPVLLYRVLDGREEDLSLLMVTNMQSSKANIKELICRGIPTPKFHLLHTEASFNNLKT